MAGANFLIRNAEHLNLMEKVEDDLRGWGYPVFRNGREAIQPYMKLPSRGDPSTKSIRFAPDLNIEGRGRVVFIEVKNSRFIEKDPYEWYKLQRNIGIQVYIVFNFGNDKGLLFSSIDNLELEPGMHERYPIIDGWITPRAHPNYEMMKMNYLGDGKPFGGSGTPHRQVSKKSLTKWSFINFNIECKLIDFIDV